MHILLFFGTAENEYLLHPGAPAALHEFIRFQYGQLPPIYPDAAIAAVLSVRLLRRFLVSCGQQYRLFSRSANEYLICDKRFFLARHTALPPQPLCAADTSLAFLRTHQSASRVSIRPSPCTAPCRIGCPYYLYRRDTPGSSLGYGAFGSLSLLAWPTPPFPLLPPGSSFAPPPASFPLFRMRRNPPPSLCTPAFC